MRVKVLLFAGCREIVGKKEIDFEVCDGATVATVKQMLIDTFPPFARVAASLSVARNSEYTSSDIELSDGDEIAFIPPVSGG